MLNATRNEASNFLNLLTLEIMYVSLKTYKTSTLVPKMSIVEYSTAGKMYIACDLLWPWFVETYMLLPW